MTEKPVLRDNSKPKTGKDKPKLRAREDLTQATVIEIPEGEFEPIKRFLVQPDSGFNYKNFNRPDLIHPFDFQKFEKIYNLYLSGQYDKKDLSEALEVLKSGFPLLRDASGSYITNPWMQVCNTLISRIGYIPNVQASAQVALSAISNSEATTQVPPTPEIQEESLTLFDGEEKAYFQLPLAIRTELINGGGLQLHTYNKINGKGQVGAYTHLKSELAQALKLLIATTPNEDRRKKELVDILDNAKGKVATVAQLIWAIQKPHFNPLKEQIPAGNKFEVQMKAPSKIPDKFKNLPDSEQWTTKAQEFANVGGLIPLLLWKSKDKSRLNDESILAVYANLKKVTGSQADVTIGDIKSQLANHYNTPFVNLEVLIGLLRLPSEFANRIRKALLENENNIYALNGITAQEQKSKTVKGWTDYIKPTLGGIFGSLILYFGVPPVVGAINGAIDTNIRTSVTAPQVFLDRETPIPKIESTNKIEYIKDSSNGEGVNNRDAGRFYQREIQQGRNFILDYEVTNKKPGLEKFLETLRPDITNYSISVGRVKDKNDPNKILTPLIVTFTDTATQDQIDKINILIEKFSDMTQPTSQIGLSQLVGKSKSELETTMAKPDPSTMPAVRSKGLTPLDGQTTIKPTDLPVLQAKAKGYTDLKVTDRKNTVIVGGVGGILVAGAGTVLGLGAFGVGPAADKLKNLRNRKQTPNP